MTVVDGKVSFDMPLPIGAVQSSLVFLYEPGMEFSLPGGMKGALKENDFGRKFYVVNRIEIETGTRMVMSIRGLPHYPAWRKYVAYAAGLIVLGFIVVGMCAIFRRPPEDEVVAETSGSEWGSRKREELYDSLVRIEAERESGEIDAKEYDKTRNRLMAKLEANYEQRANRSSR